MLQISKAAASASRYCINLSKISSCVADAFETSKVGLSICKLNRQTALELKLDSVLGDIVRYEHVLRLL